MELFEPIFFIHFINTLIQVNLACCTTKILDQSNASKVDELNRLIYSIFKINILIYFICLKEYNSRKLRFNN